MQSAVLLLVFVVAVSSLGLKEFDYIIVPVSKGRIKEFLDKERLKLYLKEEQEAETSVNIYKLSQRDGFNYENFVEDRIVGGREIDDINDYPYHVAYGLNCAGAIIDKDWILTAGHCGTKAYIRVGSKYLTQGKLVGVRNTIVHPMWYAKNKQHAFDYDFQLLELNQSLEFNDNVQPIKMGYTDDLAIGKYVTVTGWGNTYENGPHSNVLRAITVPIIAKESCQKVPFNYFKGTLTPRMFCAGYKEGKIDACQGDSGGPAVANGRLLGMVSFGYGCATPDSYGVYSKVPKIRDWIKATTRIRHL